MGKYFGTDGVRGRANDILTAELAFALGRAVATVWVKEHQQECKRPQMIIGRDTRLSGTMLESALAAGLCSCGVNAISLGVIPTPGVAVLCRHYNCPGAVISASHNPFADNGIKFFSEKGYKLPDTVEEEIESYIDSPVNVCRPAPADLGTVFYVDEGRKIYLDFLKSQVAVDLTGLKIVVDAANGAAAGLGEELFASLGAQVVTLGGVPNGININDNCGSTHPENLALAVVRHKAQIGVALDGDADRLILVDEKGNIIDGDHTLAICAADMKERGKLNNNTLVITVMSNMGLHIAMKEHGIRLEETKVGDRYVLERMLEKQASLGGEQSGHLIFNDYNTTGDGLVSALHLLAVMSRSGKPLSELAKIMKSLPQVLVNVPVKHKEDFDEDADIASVINEVKQTLKDRGRVLVRPSGTEMLLRVMAEGEDEQELKQLVKMITAVISKKRGA